MLGVRQFPTGNNEEGKWYLQDLGKWWKEEVWTGKLNWKDAWNKLTSRVLKLIQYPLPVTKFSQDECCQIMWTIMEGGLPA